MHTDKLCQQYLDGLYLNITGHRVNARQTSNIAETYGEILYPSINKLIREMNLTAADRFYDLGSGLGKLTIQTFLTSPVKESCGIEIIPELHHHSLLAGEKASRDLPEFFQGARQLTFKQGSFLEIPIDAATVVLIASPCFTPTILHQLSRIINATPSIRMVLSLRPLGLLKQLPFKKTLRIECSWDSALCYCYGN